MVAGAYADARRVAARAARAELLPRVARAAGVDVCLLDTAVKDGRGLLDWLSPEALTALVDEAHELGLEVALAGALRAEDLPVGARHRRRHRRRPLGRVRGSARRSGSLDPARVRALRAACAATPRASR